MLGCKGLQIKKKLTDVTNHGHTLEKSDSRGEGGKCQIFLYWQCKKTNRDKLCSNLNTFGANGQF